MNMAATGGKMTKQLFICFVILCLVGCASSSKSSQTSVFRGSDVYSGTSFDTVWNIVMEAVQELGFTIRSEKKEQGLLDAVGQIEAVIDGETETVRTLMNIVIKDESGMIRVDCVAMLPSGEQDLEPKDQTVVKFFELLNQKI
jgi:hypothetical protein